MNPDERYRELLAKLLDGECSDVEQEALAALCRDDRERRENLRAELAFAELLRHATAESEAMDAAEHRIHRSVAAHASGEAHDLETLATRLVSGEAADHEIDGLIRLCRSDDAKAARLRELLKWDDLLGQAADESRSESAFLLSLETRMWADQEEDHFVEATQSKIVSLHPEAVQPPAPQKPAAKVLQFPLTVATWATAAAAAITVGFFFLFSGPGSGVATIVHATEDARWEAGSAPESGGDLKAGRYQLESGVVALKFRNGAEMTIEGPAEFEVGADNQAFVHSGIAMLDQKSVSPAPAAPGDSGGGISSKSGSGGFTLGSPGLNLVETYDTVGIDARRATSTEAVVFNGGAEICLPTTGPCRNLYQYEAVRLDLKHDKLFDVPYNPKVFARSWEILAGVERNTGSVRIELPGSLPERDRSGGNEVQVFVEKDRFVPDREIEVDTLDPGHFAAAGSPSIGRPLGESGELRSYLVQLWPGQEKAGAKPTLPLEASVTFAHEVVGVIFSSERLEKSDSMVGTEVTQLDSSLNRGLDVSGAAQDSILLSDDRRTVNFRLHSGANHDELDHVRILVALR